MQLTQKELAEVYQYIDKLPKESDLNKHQIGYYPFDKLSQVRSDYFIADNNRNVK